MSPALRGVIFDLGSTLLRHRNDDHATPTRMRADLAGFLAAEGLPLDRDEFIALFAAKMDEFFIQRLNDWVEVTSAYVLRETLAELGQPPLTDEMTGRALAAYFAYSETLWEPMPAVYETLDAVAERGYRMGIISNASDDANVQRMIDNAGLRRWFDPILVSAVVGVRKPNPRIFEMALEAWSMTPAEAVMVGDTLGADVLGAQMAGMRSVWFASRAGAPANAAHRHTIQPDAIIHHLAELPAVLASMENS